LIQNGVQFVDDSFPPIGRSLHYDGSSGKVAQWLRVSHVKLYSMEEDEIGDGIGQFLRRGWEMLASSVDQRLQWTVFSSPKPSDICQGLLGNCW